MGQEFFDAAGRVGWQAGEDNLTSEHHETSGFLRNLTYEVAAAANLAK
jgi:hypothetical protein